MNFRDLKYLIAVAECQHFGHAALHSHVSQPTLSAQIKKLEEELGVTVFERKNKQLIITPIGEQIIAKARVILQEMEDLKSIASSAKDPLMGEYNLGILPTIAPYLLPHVIPTIKRFLPKISLQVFEDKTAQLSERLLNGRLDSIILTLPYHLPHCETNLLYHEPFYVALPLEHRLLAKMQLRPNDLQHEKLLLLQEGHCLREQTLKICKQSGNQTSNQSSQANSLETLIQMVALDSGIALMPALASKVKMIESDRVKLLPFRAPAPSREVAMMWRTYSVRSPVSLRISKLITRIMKTVLLVYG